MAPLLLAAALAPTTATALEFTVAPVQQEILAAPGGVVEQPLAVLNRSDEPLTFDVTVWDWWYTDDGHRFEPPGTLPTSAATWFTAHPRVLQLGAGETGKLVLHGSVPDDAPPGAFAVAFVEGRPLDDARSAGLELRPAGRIGVLLMVRLEGAGSPAVSAGAPEVVSPTPSTPLELRLPITNEGDVHTFVALKSVLRDDAGAVVGRVDARPLRTLPGQSRTLEATWTGALEPGRYDLVGALTYDTSATLPFTHSFHIDGEP